MAAEEQTPRPSTSDEKQLCLAFANTADWHASHHPEEKLTSYNDLVSWAHGLGALTHPEAKHLVLEAKRRPGDGAATLQRAIVLREAIYRLFSSIAGRRQPETEDLKTLNSEIPRALTQLRILPTESGFAWGWAGKKDDLDRMLWPVARSAADLLASKDLNRVGQCADDRGCGYLFLDMSRNRSRRWCEMKDCGNRAKAKRHYRRARKAPEK